jgi:DNA-binding NarL/FixJ family response regulator
MAEEAPIGVVIAEDHYLLREGTRALLEDSGQVRVLATAGDATELLATVTRLRPDAVVTDIRMPPDHHMEGIRAAHEIRREQPEVGVVVLSQHADASYATTLLEHGSAGLAYLLKDRLGDVGQLLLALRTVCSGGSVIDPVVIDALVSLGARDAGSPLSTLTPRELDVLREMAQGKTNAGIERTLMLSSSTVEKHVNAIFGKLGLFDEPMVNRRVTAVLTFLQNT